MITALLETEDLRWNLVNLAFRSLARQRMRNKPSYVKRGIPTSMDIPTSTRSVLVETGHGARLRRNAQQLCGATGVGQRIGWNANGRMIWSSSI